MSDLLTLSLFSADPNPAKNKTIEATVSVPWEELSRIIVTRNWSPAVFENKARNLSNYRGSPHLFAFDIDEGMTLAEACEKFKSYQCLIATSRNHQKVKHPGQASEKPACDRFRVIFRLSEPLTTDDDFKATWEAYKDQYPLDPQTRSSSMFFFKCTDVVFDNPDGHPLQVVKSAEWQDVRNDSYTFTKNDTDPTRGVLSKRSQDFLAHGAPAGMFNLRLFQCAVDHLEQRYPEPEFLERLGLLARSGVIGPLDDTDRATIRSAYNREPKYGKRPAGRSSVDYQKMEIAARIMDGEFLQCIQRDATLDYRIVDYENREVERIANPQILERHISAELKKPENHYNTSKKEVGPDGKSTFVAVTKPMTIPEVLDLWRRDGNALTSLPEPVLWRGAPGWCHKRLNFDLAPNQPHPAWDEFLSRLSAPEVFQAWVFSCFVPEHETRQALWLCGKSGEDGKTKVINLLAELFGDAAASISGGQLKSDNRFFLSQFLGKRMAVYPDCMSQGFPQTEVFRNLTGGDTVTMEFKNGGFIHGALRLKLLIGSNFEPAMSGGNYDQSRMLLVDVGESPSKDDPQWPKRLRDEMAAFLGDCSGAFKRLCPRGGKILVPEPMKDRLSDVTEKSQEGLQKVFDEYFDLAAGGKVGPRGENLDPWVSAHQLRNVLAAQRYQNHEMDRVVGQFRVFLETRHGVKRRRKGDQKWYYFGLVFRDEAVAERFTHGAF